ncbi:MAG TPA: hypothetical protein VGP12_00790, partial [Nitrosospira sp.]|nr:hypothetical protein [Nitrosospira sp.]
GQKQLSLRQRQRIIKRKRQQPHNLREEELRQNPNLLGPIVQPRPGRFPLQTRNLEPLLRSPTGTGTRQH